MASNSNANRKVPSNTNQLHRSALLNNARGLQGLGNVSKIDPESRPASPFSSSFFQQPMAASNPSFSGLPPPLPPKHNAYRPSYNRYSPVSNYFSPYSRYTSGYPGYGMSPYGPLAGSNSFSSFSQMAEESTRPAFESIESVVQVVGSISMMLDSTYHAVYSSYSAILGVVDQFSNLKDHFSQILSTLAILRWLRWMCLKVLYILGVKKENPSVESAWESAEKLANSSLALDMPEGARSSAWPFFMFLGLVVGAPWLMFKLLSKSVAQKKPFDLRAFTDANGKHYITVAAYDFKATQPGELSFKAGEKLMISLKSLSANPRGGWYFACNSRKETGLIPSTYMRSKNNDPNSPVVYRATIGNIPSGAVREAETVNNAIDEDSVTSPENPANELIEKSDSCSGLTDVVVDKSPDSLDSKTNSIIGSD